LDSSSHPLALGQPYKIAWHTRSAYFMEIIGEHLYQFIWHPGAYDYV
jgi:hypothetical protein